MFSDSVVSATPEKCVRLNSMDEWCDKHDARWWILSTAKAFCSCFIMEDEPPAKDCPVHNGPVIATEPETPASEATCVVHLEKDGRFRVTTYQMYATLNAVSGALGIPASDPSPELLERKCEHTVGNWVRSDDVDRLVRELDEAWNGKEGMARQASLCDIVGQIIGDLRSDRKREHIKALRKDADPAYGWDTALENHGWNQALDAVLVALGEPK